MGLAASDLPLERAEHEAGRVDALLGGVMQLPGDALALALDRQPLGAQPLGPQPLEDLGGVGERERDDDGHHEVRRDRLAGRMSAVIIST